MEGVHAVLADKSFSLPTDPASCTRKVGECISAWISDHIEEASECEKNITVSLASCMQVRCVSQKMRNERMWSAYHELCTS